MVYIKEAHPTDGWQVPINEREKILIKDPKTEKEREKVALDFAKQFKVTIPILLDSMKNEMNQHFAAWPDRIYVLDGQGKVAYKGGVGPGGFKPNDVPPILDKLLR